MLFVKKSTKNKRERRVVIVNKKRSNKKLGGKWLALTKQSWKQRRSRDAPIRFSLKTAVFTTDLIMERALGHEEA